MAVLNGVRVYSKWNNIVSTAHRRPPSRYIGLISMSARLTVTFRVFLVEQSPIYFLIV